MRNPWKLTSFGLAAVLAGTLASSVMADPQPNMRAALTKLRAAHNSLERATPDKGGHRVKAMELTKAAIAEVEAGIKHDNRH
jgi:hypothetical protein